MSEEEEFESELGTKEHWDKTYEDELQIFERDGVLGHVWFEEKHKQILKWLITLPNFNKDSSFLDIGCGNGYTLVELAKRGYTHLFGSDYSQGALDITKQYASAEGVSEVITLIHDDALDTSIQQQFDVIFDKGMLDAIILSPEDSQGKQRCYLATLQKLAVPGGYLVISSCNSTYQSLTSLVNEFGFVEYSRINYPVFNFGGNSGSSLTTIAFKKQ